MYLPTMPWKLMLSCSLLAVVASIVQAQTPPAGIQWRTDYNAARREAEAKGLPMLIDFITDPCFYCDKMDRQTFSDPRIVSLVNQRFIPLRINERNDDTLKRNLNILRFPTIIIGGPDGLVLHKKEGFHEAENLRETIQQTLATLTPTDVMKEKYLAAVRLEASGEFVRAISSLRDILEDEKPRPLRSDALALMKKIDKQAEDRLVRARELQDKGQGTEALEAYTEILRLFPGLNASREAKDRITSIAKKAPEVALVQRNKRARDLLAQAQEFYKSKDYIPCLDRCELVLANFGDLPEGQQAFSLASEIKNNPEWMQSAADVMTDRLGSTYLALADIYLKRGEVRRAQHYLQRVVTAFPGSRLSESAQLRLNQLQGTIPASSNGLATRP